MTSTTSTTSGPGITEDLLHHLRQGRDGLLRALDGLDDHDAHRPGAAGR